MEVVKIDGVIGMLERMKKLLPTMEPGVGLVRPRHSMTTQNMDRLISRFKSKMLEEETDPVHLAGGCYCRECDLWVQKAWHSPYEGTCVETEMDTTAGGFCSFGKLKKEEMQCERPYTEEKEQNPGSGFTGPW